MADTTFIYELIDPRTNQPRYVGKADYPHKRFEQHLIDDHNRHKKEWIQELKQLSLCPQISILAEVPIDKWGEYERHWIKKKRDEGCDLLNIRDGGPCKVEEWNRSIMVLSISQAELRLMFIKNSVGSTNRDVAKALGISAYTLNQFYHKRGVSPSTVAKIANAIGVKPSDIAVESSE